ncbi:MAG TPA: CehA/McbA family metallohydrolase [Vicinamibacterales bacterium]|nr:CehA/McbA family metallohydrolase [Vicinamibacterales bacterium]
MRRMTLWILLFAVVGGIASARQVPPTHASALRWYKGNTHAHTLESDGDSTPDVVTKWYRDHGYQFLVLSDHNVLTAIDGLNARYAVPETFTLIKGEEVTSRVGLKAVHVNGIDTRARVGAQTGASLLEVLQKSVDGIRREGGVPHINHPNFQWSLTSDELRQVRNNKLFEIYNGHPKVNNAGGGGVQGTEAAWDAILSSGVLLYGIAVDDAHNFTEPGNPDVAGPGRGWVVVRAAALGARAILEALERGDFYASTGVELTDVQSTSSSMTITVRQAPWAKYRIQFIGRGGVVLHEALDSPATYEFKGTEGYVRARILESNGRIAWVQPVLVGSR